MRRAALAGLIYFAIVFTIGFALGSVRVLLVAPVLGALGAVLVELPVMLLACWFLSGWLVRGMIGSESVQAALIMGALAFAFLMVAEFALAGLAFERMPLEQVLGWLTPDGALGLGGQILFALFPWIQRGRMSSI